MSRPKCKERKNVIMIMSRVITMMRDLIMGDRRRVRGVGKRICDWPGWGYSGEGRWG